jgi:hypothetical protein
MKALISDLIQAQKARLIEKESVLLKQLADILWPMKRVNASSALPMPQRFLTKIVFGASDCWVWRSSVDSIGYGTFPFNGEVKAHRVSYRMFKGEIPDGLFVLHKCDNRQCVNPDHLFLGTQKDNMIDMASKKRGKYPSLCGEKNPMAKLTKETVEEIRKMVESGSKQIDACKKFGVSPMTVSRIIRRESWI